MFRKSIRPALAILALLATPSHDAAAHDAAVTSPAELNPMRCLALTLYWEAKGEGADGMRAVAAVVLNRVAHAQFPNDICGVVYEGGARAPCQFHWSCNGRDNRPTEAGPWREAQTIAFEVVNRRPPDPTDGALFFHVRSLDNPWAAQRTRTAQIGAHIYYR